MNQVVIEGEQNELIDILNRKREEMLSAVTAKYVKSDLSKAQMKKVCMFEIKQKRKFYRELYRLPDDMLLSVSRIQAAELVDSVYREFGISFLEYNYYI